MTMGAAASLSLCFKALTTDSEDEFITIAPFFPEYQVFVQAAGAKLTIVPPDTKNFQIDFDALEARLNIHTKGVIINSPNNPSGAVYSEPVSYTHLAARVLQMLMKNLYRQKKKQKQKTKKKML